MTFPLPYENDLSNEEKQDIDNFIDSVYEQCKDDSKEITQLAMEASFGINAGKNRARELCRQGFFKNLLCNVTGKNRKIRGEIDRDFAVSQIASIKMIQKLAEHNKLTFEMIKNINLKLNCIVNAIDEEINQIYLQMNEFMKQVMDKFIEMSKKMERLESKVNIHDLVIFIKHHDINGVKFTDLNSNEKFLYFISEFFLTNKSLYIESDLMNLRYVMKEIGIESDDKISLLSIYDTLISNSSIADKFFKAFDKEKLNYIEDFKMPILGNINKIEKLENEEKYITDSIVEMSSKDRKEVVLNLLKNYSYNNLNMDLEKENSYFDLSISILDEMKKLIEYDKAKDYHKIPISNILTYYEKGCQYYDDNQFEKAKKEFIKIQKFSDSFIYKKLIETSMELNDFREAYNYYDLLIENGEKTFYNYYMKAVCLYKDYTEIYKYIINSIIQYRKENNEIKFVNNLLSDPRINTIENDILFSFIHNCLSFVFNKEIEKMKEEELKNKNRKELINILNTELSNEIKNINDNIGLRLKKQLLKSLYGYDENNIKKIGFEDYDNIIVSALEEAIGINDSFYANINLGVIYRELEMYDEAMAYYKKAEKIDSNSPINFINQVELMYKINGHNQDDIKKYIDGIITSNNKLSQYFIDKSGNIIIPNYRFDKGIESAFFDLETSIQANINNIEV
ncbi:tetratricopeptide repeat protein [uncultured Brachyspira sp.]|uniref:tetratricopeptide repeat protein n=1 Tax=uncultured Brachyspira sp. TaxID=221953 RepID=UPI0026308C53|nr:tetratricopeptide repeat protein [uncultured Brachyspira sp.]